MKRLLVAVALTAVVFPILAMTSAYATSKPISPAFPTPKVKVICTMATGAVISKDQKWVTCPGGRKYRADGGTIFIRAGGQVIQVPWDPARDTILIAAAEDGGWKPPFNPGWPKPLDETIIATEAFNYGPGRDVICDYYASGKILCREYEGELGPMEPGTERPIPPIKPKPAAPTTTTTTAKRPIVTTTTTKPAAKAPPMTNAGKILLGLN